MEPFFVIGNTGEFDAYFSHAVVCKPAILLTPDDAGTPVFVCGCKTRERAEEIASMYNYFMNLQIEVGNG